MFDVGESVVYTNDCMKCLCKVLAIHDYASSCPFYTIQLYDSTTRSTDQDFLSYPVTKKSDINKMYDETLKTVTEMNKTKNDKIKLHVSEILACLNDLDIQSNPTPTFYYKAQHMKPSSGFNGFRPFRPHSSSSSKSKLSNPFCPPSLSNQSSKSNTPFSWEAPVINSNNRPNILSGFNSIRTRSFSSQPTPPNTPTNTFGSSLPHSINFSTFKTVIPEVDPSKSQDYDFNESTDDNNDDSDNNGDNNGDNNALENEYYTFGHSNTYKNDDVAPEN